MKNLDQYTHPIFGTPCSRQRRHQVLNVMNGKCIVHSKNESVGSGQYCQECIDKWNALRPIKKKWSGIDWMLTNNEIAEIVGVSVPAVIYQRKKAAGLIPSTKDGLRNGALWTTKSKPPLDAEIHPSVKAAARNKLTTAIELGKITKKPCAVCDEIKVQGHHFDYTKPLEVIWLCSKHHGAIHKSINREANA